MNALVGLSTDAAIQLIERDIAVALAVESQHYQSVEEYASGQRPQVELQSWNLDAALVPYSGMTMSELWDILGLGVNQRIIGMERFLHTPGLLTSWGLPDGVRWWHDPTIPDDKKRELHPRHHQLVGVIKCLQWILAGQGGLIADDVGVGKTGQIIMTVLMYFQLLQIQATPGAIPPPALGMSPLHRSCTCPSGPNRVEIPADTSVLRYPGLWHPRSSNSHRRPAYAS